MNVCSERFSEDASVSGKASGKREAKLTVACLHGSSNHSSVLR